MKSVVLIPARMESVRFPNKPLAPILGKPMIQWVYEAVEMSSATDVFVITDSADIIRAVEQFDGQAILTSSSPKNGTERCQEAIEILASEDQEYDVIINVQGDEPLIKSDDIDLLLELFEDEEIDVATLIKPIEEEREYRSKNVVKALPTAFDGGFCDICYFSRSPIPFMDNFVPEIAFKHIGVYGFTATSFEEVKNLAPTEIEEQEKLEQLRWIQNHIVVSAVVTESELIGVDTPEDIKLVEAVLNNE